MQVCAFCLKTRFCGNLNFSQTLCPRKCIANINYVCAIDFSTFEYAAEKTAASAADSRQVGPLEDKTGGILNPKQGLDVNS